MTWTPSAGCGVSCDEVSDEQIYALTRNSFVLHTH